MPETFKFRQNAEEKTFVVSREVKAWDLIGWDDGAIMIKGGRTFYEAVIYNCGPREGRLVTLAKVIAVPGGGLRQVSRRVEPETIIQILKRTDKEETPSDFFDTWNPIYEEPPAKGTNQNDH